MRQGRFVRAKAPGHRNAIERDAHHADKVAGPLKNHSAG